MYGFSAILVISRVSRLADFNLRSGVQVTALFNNTRTLKLKAQPTNGFFAAVNQVLAGPPSLRLLPNSVRCLNSAQRFDHRALGSSRKLGGAGEHLIDGSKKRICRLSFEF